MSTAQPPTKPFVSATLAAPKLGVPFTWLRAEAEAGRIPHLRAGRRILVNLETVERVLLERSQKSQEVANGR